MSLLQLPGRLLAGFLSKPLADAWVPATSREEDLRACLRPGDVLLVEGNTRFSRAVKYLTQSSWSHAALFLGWERAREGAGGEPEPLLEADVREGVRTVPLSRYAGMHTRICRPVGLYPEEVEQVLEHAQARLGQKYDLKNIVDLARYLVQTPWVPVRWRRRLLAIGSGDPTRAICSSLIAEAFQSVRYPILPEVEVREGEERGEAWRREVLYIRHHSLFAPRDFDVSPYFAIVKPTLARGFDPHRLEWGEDRERESAPDGGPEREPAGEDGLSTPGP